MRSGPLVITGMGGLGDGVYQRPFVAAQSAVRDVYITTPWPELYADLPRVRPLYPAAIGLRTQAKNMERQPETVWFASQIPERYERARFFYRLREPRITILQELERCIGLARKPFRFDLPDFGPSPVTARKPVAFLRPVTTRKEWANNARAPRPEYVEQAAGVLRAAGYHVVAVADIAPPAEWLEGRMPVCDQYFVRGELSARQMLALIQHSAVVVGGVGFIVPVALAAGRPLVVIGGGQGGHNAPERITDPRLDLARTRFVMPERFCMCTDRAHRCPKEIRDFRPRFREALLAVTGAVGAAA